MTSTLVSEVVIERPVSTLTMEDVPVTVDQTYGGGAILSIERPTMKMTIGLSGAERISLIEALGGVVVPQGTFVVRSFDRDGSQIGAQSV